MDVVVTVPKDQWEGWLDEGELPGLDRVECPTCGWRGRVQEWKGHRTPKLLSETCFASSGDRPEWHFFLGGARPSDLKPGDRVYVVAHDKLRGYAPLVRIERTSGGVALVRHGGGVAVTVDFPIRGFQGFRYRWWPREIETSFPDFEVADATPAAP
jgi:hypothetical protein